MADPLPSSGPIDLDALDDYLMSDHVPDGSMGLSDLDGFLTGIEIVACLDTLCPDLHCRYP